MFSGVAALIYQVTWFKHLSYFLGNSTYTQSLVLATYMGGLAIGAWWWGRKADKSAKSLRVFAFLEIGIALYCFFYYPIFEVLKSCFIDYVSTNDLPSDGGYTLFVKLIISAAGILIPTILMGGTLPVLVKYFSARINQVGKNVAIFYFINSLGAVIGTLIAGFYLLQFFGLRNTTYIGAGMDLAIGAVCLLLSYKIDSSSEAKNEKKERKERFTLKKVQYKTVLLIAGISGLSAMIYEIVWLRLLIPILSSSTYSFSVILAVFISGITIGSYIVYRIIDRIKNPYRFLGYCQMGIVITILLSMPFYERLPYYIWSAIGDPATSSASYSYYIFIQFFFVFLLIIIPTIFMGMTLPIASRLCVTEVKNTGRVIGNVFAINTLGTVIGSLAAGLILIPLIGIKNTLQFAVLLNLVLALIVLLTKKLVSQKMKIAVLSILGVSILIYFGNTRQDSWAYSIMLSDVPRKINRIKPPNSYADFYSLAEDHDKIHYYQEGVNGTIVVAQKNKETYLFTNGKGDANSISDLSSQISLGLTPIILHPSPDSVFVIGYGAGTTIGHVMLHSRVKYGEVAEISDEVIDASKYFNDINGEPLRNKNLRVIRDDGLSALLVSPRKYDVIISQPSNPWSAGMGSLFTQEFFQTCKDKLHKGGYVAQWFNLYEMDDKSLKLILRTALSEFKHVTLWHISNSDILILCSENEINRDLKQIEKNYLSSEQELKKIDIHAFPAFLSQQLTSDRERIVHYAGDGPLNTEDLPLLEHWAPRAYFHDSKPEKFYAIDERSDLLKHKNHLLRKYMNSKPNLTKDEILQAGLFQSTGGNKELAYYLAELNPMIYLSWAEKARQLGNIEKANEFEQLASTASSKMDTNSTIVDQTQNGVHEKNADVHANKGAFSQAIKEIDIAIKEDGENAVLYYKKGTFHLSLNELDKSVLALETAISIDNKMIDAYINLANSKGKQSKFREVISILNEAEKLTNSNAKIYFNRGYAKALVNEVNGAIFDFSKAISLNPDYGQAYLLRGRAYMANGNRNNACSDFNLATQLNVQGAREIWQQACK